MILSEGFTPFFGKVEDLLDPTDNGRIRVRVFVYNTENKGVLPTENLKWFAPVLNNTESLAGVGKSPTGYAIGSMVFGYYIDEDRQNGIVIGSVPGIENNTNDVNHLARGDGGDHIQQLKDSCVVSQNSASGDTWDEPETQYAADYPYNTVTQTKSGHIIEIDDTPGAERIKVFHKSGSMFEFHPNGDVVERVQGDKYTIEEMNVRRRVGSDLDISILGSLYELIGQNVIKKSEGFQKLQAPNIELGNPEFLEPMVLGNKLLNWITNELIPWLNNHQHISASPGSPTSAAQAAPTGPFQAGTASSGGAVYSQRNSTQ